MHSFFMNIKEKMVSSFLDETDTPPISDIDLSTNNPPIQNHLHVGFHLPITYLDESKKHELSPIVCSDLELKSSLSDSNSMYEVLFRPSHDFAKALIPDWSKQYTTDTTYLENTQCVLREIPEYIESSGIKREPTKISGREAVGDRENSGERSSKEFVLNTQKIVEIWESIKEDESFMERYSYMDWEMLHHLNHSAYFLQIISMVQLFSPILSLLLPFLLLLIPFFLLKLRGVDISVSNYIDMLHSITKNHFIGMIMNQVRGNLSIEKIAYLLLIVAFYGFQIYQNVRSCMRFHQNITQINCHLLDMKTYISNVVKKMECFSNMHAKKESYRLFCQKTDKHCDVLHTMLSELSQIQRFSYSANTASSFGYLLKCYYRIHSIEEYGDALRYSFGFEGYIDNLCGVYENLVAGNVSYVAFSEKEATQFVDQYYPANSFELRSPEFSRSPTASHPEIFAHIENNHIVNTCHFKKNMIISAPNAAGKTTLLKSTAINIVFSQQLGCGFYGEGSTIQPYTHIHSYLNIPDTSGRDSLFQAESRRCKEIIDLVSENVDGCRHFAILDELYSGTNPTEAGKSAYAFLKYLSKYDHIDFMLTTHYVYVCKKFRKSKKIQNYKMGVIEDVGVEGGYRFTYRLEEGISKIQGAIKILKEMNYPQEMLDSINSC